MEIDAEGFNSMLQDLWRQPVEWRSIEPQPFIERGQWALLWLRRLPNGKLAGVVTYPFPAVAVSVSYA